MAKMTIKQLQRKLSKVPKTMQQAKVKTLGDAGNEVVKQARLKHAYKKRTGTLDRSIDSVVRVEKEDVGLKVWINPDLVTTKGGYNYGVIQHDGKGSGYKASPISPKYGTKGTQNQEHDHFLYNAWKNKLPELRSDMEELPSKVMRKLGL